MASTSMVNWSHHGSLRTSGLYRLILSVSSMDLVLPLHRDVGAKLHVLVLEANASVGLAVGERVLQPVVVVAQRMVLAVVRAPALVAGQRRRRQAVGAVQKETELHCFHEVGVVDLSLVHDHGSLVPFVRPRED